MTDDAGPRAGGERRARRFGAILERDELEIAFCAHTSGKSNFTRRMAVLLADKDGTTPKDLVLRLERIGLLKQGSWAWFEHHGGITNEQIAEVRAGRLALSNSERTEG